MPTKARQKKAYQHKQYEESKAKAADERASSAAMSEHKKDMWRKHSKTSYQSNPNPKKRVNKKYRAANKAVISNYFMKYYASRTTKVKAALRNYNAANRDKLNTASKKNYAAHKDAFEEYYQANRTKLKAGFIQYNKANRSKLQQACREYYKANQPELTTSFSAYYQSHRDDMKKYFQNYYYSHEDEMKSSFARYYVGHQHERKDSFRHYYKTHQHEMRASFCEYYESHKENMKSARQQYYQKNKPKVLAARARNFRTANAKAAVKRARKYHAHQKGWRCADRRWRYHLAQPNPLAKHHSIVQVTQHILTNTKCVAKVLHAFKQQHGTASTKMSAETCKRAASSIAAQRLVNLVLQVRKYRAGALLRAIRSINRVVLTDRDDFGEGLHTANSEPFFYEAAYLFNDRTYDRPGSVLPRVLSIDTHGKCRPPVHESVPKTPPTAGRTKEATGSADNNTATSDTCATDNSGVTDKKGATTPKSWQCCSKCKPLTAYEVKSILTFKSAFEGQVSEVRKLLDTCDDCPNAKYSKTIPIELADSNAVHYSSKPLSGHSLLCYNGTECTSNLRILRAASTHFPVLRSLLRNIYDALKCHKFIVDLDAALTSGNFDRLLSLSDVASCKSLFSNEIERTQELTDGELAGSILTDPNLEENLQVRHANIIAMYEDAVSDFPLNPCCSCQQLHQRKNVTVVSFKQQLGRVWPQIKKFLLKEDPKAGKKKFFMCTYCKTAIKKNNMPGRCVLNCLELVPIPTELSRLDCLSRQFIQKAKPYQTVVRLGTYTGKVPARNSLKACKGTMFFLPLPLSTYITYSRH